MWRWAIRVALAVGLDDWAKKQALKVALKLRKKAADRINGAINGAVVAQAEVERLEDLAGVAASEPLIVVTDLNSEGVVSGAVIPKEEVPQA